ncbi:MAG: addiction module toxin RelE [Muribaculaceae bacterium]|nr:addiction module toxin RelE [Muribaculaceae bacterium]MDE6786489.1 addiction module toxin RelE [Muribaculaceae bacterium]
MNFEIITTPDFERSFKTLSKRHRSLKSDFHDFSEGLKQNPFIGDELTPGIRKIRMAISSKGRGKSGGARVITYTIVTLENSGEVYLLDIYDKNDFSTVDVSTLQKIVKDLGVSTDQ